MATWSIEPTPSTTLASTLPRPEIGRFSTEAILTDVDTLFDDGQAGDSTADVATRDTQGASRGRPLAVRVRPRGLAEFVGQSHLLAKGSALRTAIEQGHPHSMVLYGPPGSGKTTLARIVAERSRAAFEELSAVAAGRAEVRAVIERAAHRRDTGGQQTVLFLDEIHRFNKAQQDALLPAVEEGLVTLIGATTENPAFEVNGALLSRVRVYALQALTPQELETVLRHAIDAGERVADGAATAGRTASRPPPWRWTRTRWSSWRRAAKATRARR